MFYYISGGLALLEANCAVVDAGGVGYRLTISQTTHDALPRPVQPLPKVRLFTYMAIREDAVELFGFATNEELSAFKLLISVSGSAPRRQWPFFPCSLLKSSPLLYAAKTPKPSPRPPASGQKQQLASCWNSRTSYCARRRRIILLPQPSKASSPAPSPTASPRPQDALIVLGYTRGEALTALRAIDTTGMELEDIIRAALKKLMK